MIINLKGKVEGEDIFFDECPLYFQNNQFVHVNEVFIQWKKPCKDIFGFIESTMIDRSPVNIDQQLIFIHQIEESNYMYYSPTHIQQYKIQCSSLQSSLFKIHLNKPEKIVKINLQLYITDERIQFFNN